MGNEVAKTEGDGLSEMQARFVAELLSGAEPEEARELAGYSQTTPTVSILAGKLVQNAIQAAVDGRMRGDLRLKAMKTLEKIMDGNSAQAALGAAKIVLDYGQDDQRADDKPQSEMSIAELEALIERKQAELKDVTPRGRA